MGLFSNIEKLKDAKEYRNSAKELISNAEQSYNSVYASVQRDASRTESAIREHINYKKEIVKELDKSIVSCVQAFGGFDIGSKVSSSTVSHSNARSAISALDSSDSSFARRVSSFGSRFSPSAFPSSFDLFGMLASADEEYRKAKELYQEAKQYRDELRAKRTELQSNKERMSELRSFISSEKYELDSLMRKLRKMSGELSAAMQRNSFTEDEATYLKGVQKISESIIMLLKTEFLGDGFSVSQKYQAAFDKVKQINQQLPSEPTIRDRSLLRTILQVADSMIVY